MKQIWVKQNKYIRLRISKVGCYYRADISVNKHCYDGREQRYYEINFDVFSPYDYSSDYETFEEAKKWLYKELNILREEVREDE